jgi:hypothetical protein
VPVTTYGWRSGAHIALDAQKAGEALARIEKRHNGLLEPEMVVEEARGETSPLHAHFQWNDHLAAEAYRTDQAREIIRALTIDIGHSNVEPRFVRGFVNVEVGGEQGYVSTTTAMSSAELRRQVIRKAWEELEAWRQRHAELTELGRVFAAIDEARGAF